MSDNPTSPAGAGAADPVPPGSATAPSSISAAWARHRVSRRETRKGTAIALAAWIFAVYDFILFGTLLPGIQEDFGWSNATAVAVSTAISVGTAIVVFGVGPLVDRLGRRKGMLITVSGTALASAATAATFNPAYLVGVRSIGGLGLAEQSVNTTYLNEIYALSEDDTITKRRGFIYSIVQGGWPLGTLLAAGFAAAFLPLVGWRGCFLIATFPALLVILVRRTLKETPQFTLQDRVRKLLKQGKTTEAHALAAEYGLEPEKKAPLREVFAPESRRNTIFLGLAWFTNWFGIQTFSVLGTSVLVEGKNVDFAGALIQAGGKQRPLGIPVIVDRALQARVKSALEPEWEARFEPKSYGFRPGRGCHDAIEARPPIRAEPVAAQSHQRRIHEPLPCGPRPLATKGSECRSWSIHPPATTGCRGSPAPATARSTRRPTWSPPGAPTTSPGPAPSSAPTTWPREPPPGASSACTASTCRPTAWARGPTSTAPCRSRSSS